MENLELSAKMSKSIDSIRAAFTAYVKVFGTLMQSRAEIAPRFTKALDAYKEETGGTLADFCRLFDPNVPTERDGYKRHKTYQAADYLVRLSARAEREHLSPTAKAKRIAERPITGNRALAPTLAAVLPLIDPDAVHKVFEIFGSKLNWTDTMVENLKSAVEEEDPLFGFRAPKGVHITHSLRVVERAA